MGPSEPSSIQAGSRVALRCWGGPGRRVVRPGRGVPAGPDVSEGRRLACGRGALVEIRVAPRDRLRGGEDVAETSSRWIG